MRRLDRVISSLTESCLAVEPLTVKGHLRRAYLCLTPGAYLAKVFGAEYLTARRGKQGWRGWSSRTLRRSPHFRHTRELSTGELQPMTLGSQLKPISMQPIVLTALFHAVQSEQQWIHRTPDKGFSRPTAFMSLIGAAGCGVFHHPSLSCDPSCCSTY